MAVLAPGHPDPPHPLEDVVNAERIPAKAAVPKETQPALEKTCPTDLPATYGTALETGLEGVPGKDFYTNIPANARAIFSTEDGKNPFRNADENISTAEDTKTPWPQAKLEEECNSLRRKYCNYMRELKAPRKWSDLYNYFDAYDIRTKGPRNLMEVLNRLSTENGIIAQKIEPELAQIFLDWLDERNLTTGVLQDGKTIYTLSQASYNELPEVDSNYKRILETVLTKKKALLVKEEVPKECIVASAKYDSANRSSESSSFVEVEPYNHSPGRFGQPCHIQAISSSAAVATSHQPRAITIVASQSRPTNSVKYDGKKLEDNKVQENAVSFSHHNQPHLSVNTKNNIGAVATQIQASPSPLPRKDRLVQHATTDRKSLVTHAQESSSNSPRPNDAKQPESTVPKAAKPIPSQPRAFEMADLKPTWKGGNIVPSRAHPQNSNRNRAGRQISEKMGQTTPKISHGGPSTPSPQNSNQGNHGGSARVELPPKPQPVGSRAMSFDDAPYAPSKSYGNEGFMQGNGNQNCALGQHAMYEGASQTAVSHQMSAAAPGCNSPPAGNTSAFRDGSYPRGKYGYTGGRGPRSYRHNADYPAQAGKGPFYSQNNHQVETRRNWHQNDAYHYNNRSYNHRSPGRQIQRERSVFGVIDDPPSEHREDIKSRVKSKMGRIFGEVEDVYLTSRTKGMAFIIRFKDENSVPQALNYPNPIYLERDLSIMVTPAYGSRWSFMAGIGALHINKGVPGNQQWQPYQNATHSVMLPRMYNPPAWGLAGPNTRGPHNLRQADEIMLNHVPHNLSRTSLYGRGNRAHSLGPTCSQPVMPQQAAPQASHGFHVPKQEASTAVSRQDMPQQSPPQSALGFQDPEEDASNASSIQEKKKQKKFVADREVTKSLELKSQSKLRFDEVMENDDPIEKNRVEPPTSQRSRSCQTSRPKARVSLPSASPPKPTQSKAPKIEQLTKEPGKTPLGQDAPSKLRNTPADVITQAQLSHIGQVSNEASSEVPLAVVKGCEPLATTTAASQAYNNFTEEEVKLRRKKSNMIPQPLRPGKVKRKTCTERNSDSATREKVASPEPLPFDVTCRVLDPNQQTLESEISSDRSDESRTMSASSSPSSNSPSSNLTKAEVSGVKSNESRTISASSSPRSNSSASSNPTKTPPNRNTAGSPLRLHSQVLKTPRSPTNNKAVANKDHKDQNPTSQVETVAKGEGFRLPSSLDQGSFKFPGNGRETRRVKKGEKRDTVRNGGSVCGRNTPSKKREWKNQSASRSIDFSDQNQQQASQLRAEVIGATKSAAGNKASTSATDCGSQKPAPRSTPPASVGEIQRENLRNASGDGDSGEGADWQTVRRRRRTSKRTNTLESSDRQGEKPGMSAGRTATASNTAVTAANGGERTVKLAVPASATTPKAGNASAKCPNLRDKRGSDSPMSEREDSKKPEAK